MLMPFGSISNSTAFLMGSRADAWAGLMAELTAATPAPAAKNVRLFIIILYANASPSSPATFMM